MRPLLLLSCIPFLYAAEPPREIQYSGTLSMPARLKDGQLISLHADARPFKDMHMPGPELGMYRRLSSDQGQTWSAPERVFTFPAGVGTIVPQVYPLVDSAGDLHAFTTRYFSLPKKDRTNGHSIVLHLVSKDQGRTWSAPNQVNFGHTYTGAINSLVQLKSGRILGALSYTSENFIEAVSQREFRVVSFYSDDLGKTWTVGQDDMQVPFGPQVVHPGAIEPVLLELAPNRVQMFIRTQTLRLYESFSSDGGAHFSLPQASRFMAPDSPAAVLRLRNGNLLLVWNDIQSYPKGVAGHFRQYLYGAKSKDNGQTWSKPKFVGPLAEPDKAGSRGDYPFLCEASGGAVLLYYTRFGLRAGASYEKQHNELVRLDPSWFE